MALLPLVHGRDQAALLPQVVDGHDRAGLRRQGVCKLCCHAMDVINLGCYIDVIKACCHLRVIKWGSDDEQGIDVIKVGCVI